MAEAVLMGAAAYFAVGVLVGVAFVTFGVGRLDPAARGSSPAFRILILPGSITLWPLVLLKWARGKGRR